MDPGSGWARPEALGRIVSPEPFFIGGTLAPGAARVAGPNRSGARQEPRSDPFACKLPVNNRPRGFGAYGSRPCATPVQVLIEPPHAPRYRAELSVGRACR